MRWLALLAASGLVGAAQAAETATYANVRFGYSVTYPSDLLIPEREADNGDGRAFRARQGGAKMSVWGSFRDANSEPTSGAIARLYEADCRASKLTYQVIKPRLVAFSCVTTAGHVIYQKTLVGRDVLRTVRFEYPASDQPSWNPVVAKVAGSLRATGEALP